MFLKESTPEQALRRANIWKYVNIAFLVICFIFSVLRTGWISFILALVYRGTLLYVVFKFIDEIQTVISSGSSYLSNIATVPSSVVVKQ